MGRGQIEAVTDGKGVLQILELHHQAIVDALVERGVFVPCDDTTEAASGELQAQSRLANATSQTNESRAPAPADVDVSLLHAIRKKEQEKPSSWFGGRLMLGISLAIFAAAGGAAWSWKFTLLLIPVLLLHELGRFVFMKLFDYRNVKFFFIPLFGAAVSGTNRDVAGWKRVVVSLLGPLPGIILAIPLGIIGLLRDNDLLLEISKLSLVLNGFNLLPALPLEGGWILHGILFSRHAFLERMARQFARNCSHDRAALRRAADGDLAAGYDHCRTLSTVRSALRTMVASYDAIVDSHLLAIPPLGRYGRENSLAARFSSQKRRAPRVYPARHQSRE